MKPDSNSLPSTYCEQNSIPISSDAAKDNSDHKIESLADFAIQKENPQPEDDYIHKPKTNKDNEKLLTKTSEPPCKSTNDTLERPNFIAAKQEADISKQIVSDNKLNFISVPRINEKKEVYNKSITPSISIKYQINNEKDESYSEEIIISAPKKIDKKEYDNVSVVPVHYTKEKIIPRKEVRLAPDTSFPISVNQEMPTPINQPRSVVRISFDTKSGGIADMLSDLEDIGVSNVNVRSGSELRQNISQKAYSFDTFNHDELAKPEKITNTDKRGFLRPESNPEKPSVKAVSYRAANTKINMKPKYEEKPQIVQDNYAEVKTKPKHNPVPISHRELKQKPVYKEVNTIAKENDCDWDEWDD